MDVFCVIFTEFNSKIYHRQQMTATCQGNISAHFMCSTDIGIMTLGRFQLIGLNQTHCDISFSTVPLPPLVASTEFSDKYIPISP